MPTSAAPAIERADDDALQRVLRRAELAARIERQVLQDGVHATAIPGMHLMRSSQDVKPVHGVCQPALCLIAQGRKRVLLADEITEYDALHYLCVAHDLPVSGEVIGALPEQPYLSFRLDIDTRELAALMLDIGRPAEPRNGCPRGLFTGMTSSAMLDAVLRLVRLLETPADIPALAPLVIREILYRLLTSEHGWRLAQVATPDSRGQRISRAIAWLQQHYREPLRVEDMARSVHMSVSSLHHQFKAVTAMSPLQYQKQLRLQEARRLMLAEGVDAATAGHRVGYESPSQFSREYARLFGLPPARDIRGLRQPNPHARA
ncbi:AraC family transcriptional regulator [Schlegelella sp. S2-27]|uniref:AraC family transcriptional regulator n=1 Tax=Caldimonas mangrovi TaxID=2944811 RepID=A0ABT0YW48_9BURK|nr:AraC family transcriptional regulator [Caldimonas mangrovi]MCM5682336.1 AraC family transcriptional regulator [Caldimonas mangrovi]